MSITTYPKEGGVQITPCERDNSCYPVYDPGCESTGPVCCPPARPREPCPPFHTRDAIRIRDYEVERVFDIRAFCDDQDFMAIHHCIDMQFKRPCDCDWCWNVKPLRVTTDGKVVFRWPTCFLDAQPGYWYVRLRIDGKPVKYIPFYKPFMKVNIHSTEPLDSNHCNHCRKPWSVCCCDHLEVDQEGWVEPSDENCGGCGS